MRDRKEVLAEATDKVVRIVLIVVVRVAIVHIDVPSIVLWIVRVLSRRPIIVTLKTTPIIPSD